MMVRILMIIIVFLICKHEAFIQRIHAVAKISAEKTCFEIGSKFTATCTYNGLFRNMYLVDTETKSPTSLQKFLSNDGNRAVVVVDRVPDSWFGKRFIHCNVSKNNSLGLPDMKVFYFGYRLQPVKSISCVGENLTHFRCQVSPSFDVSKKGDNITGHLFLKKMEAYVYITDNSSSRRRENCGNSSKHACYVSKDGKLLMRHRSSDIMKFIDIHIAYCNNFSCSPFNQSFNRSSIERPLKLCFTNTTSTINGFHYWIDKTKLIRGMAYRHIVLCTSENLSDSVNVTISQPRGLIEGLQPGAEYECSLQSAFAFGGLWSRRCTKSIRTLETDPESGPIFLRGMFSEDGRSRKLYFLPPKVWDQHGCIVEYGLSKTRIAPPAFKSRGFYIETREEPPYYLSSRNTCGWSRMATEVKAKDVPSKKYVLPAPSFELWKRKEEHLYDVTISLPNGLSEDLISNWTFVICETKPSHPQRMPICRAKFGRRKHLKVNLLYEKVALLIQSKDGRTSNLMYWIQDHCLRKAIPSLKPDWFSAKVKCSSSNNTLMIKAKSSHLRCSSSLRTPIRNLTMRYRCKNSADPYRDTSKNVTMKRSEEPIRILNINIGKLNNCTLYAGISDQFIRLKIQHCEDPAQSFRLTIIAVSITLVVLLVVALVICAVRICKRWLKMAREPEPKLDTFQYSYKSYNPQYDSYASVMPTQATQALLPITETTGVYSGSTLNEVSSGLGGSKITNHNNSSVSSHNRWNPEKSGADHSIYIDQEI